MTISAPEPKIDPKLSFEQALEELEVIVRRLENGDTPLEDAIGDFARGNALRSHCEQKLQDARLKVEKIIRKADGTAEPVSAPELMPAG